MLKKLICALCIFLPSALTCLIYRALGYRIGKHVKIPVFTFIYAREMEIGNDVDIRSFVLISVSKLVIGNNTVIRYGAQIKGLKNFVTGDNCFVGMHCIINCDEDVTMGFYSAVGPRSNIFSQGVFLPASRGYPVKFNKITLENYVWVCMNVTILAGSYIESNCIITPGVVVEGRIKQNTLVKINPSAYSNYDLIKIQRFSQKDNQYYSEEIMKTFCQHYDLEYEYNAENDVHIVAQKYRFKLFPDKNCIELEYDRNKIIHYDLENYYTDYCKLHIHRDFLFFLNSRMGINLRRRYIDG